MGKTKNMAKNRFGIARRSRPVLKPWGSVRSKGAVRKPDALTNKSRHVHIIVHNGKASVHIFMFDTGAQQSMIGRGGLGDY